MQEMFPIFILIASELLDLSGASRDEPHISGAPGLGSARGAQLRAESSPVPSEEQPDTGADSQEVTFHFQTAAVDPTSEMTADFIAVHTEIAPRATATLPKEVLRNLEGSDRLPALKLQDGDAFPNNLLSNVSVPSSAQGSQATTHPEQSERSVPGRAPTVPEAALSPTSSAGLPQPTPTVGGHQDSRGVAAVSPIPVLKQTEVPSPKISLLTSTVNFHPPRKETAAYPFPTSVKMALVNAGVGQLPTLAPPTTKRPKDASPQVQPDSRAAVTPAYVKSVDVQLTTSVIAQKPASVGLDAAYFRVTKTTAVQVPPLLSLNQEPAGSEDRNSVTAVIKASRHTTVLPALQQLLQGTGHSSSLPMHPEALGHDDLIPPPLQGSVNVAGRPQPLLLSRTLNCTKHHASHDTNRSTQESTVLVLQRDADHQMMTSKPEKSTSSESLRASSNSPSLGQSQISTVNLSLTTRELKGATFPPLPSASTFEKAALPPLSTPAAVHAALQPRATSVPPYAGLQPMGVPTSAARGLHVLTSTAGSGSQVQGVSAHPGPQEAFAVMPQMSTVEDSKGQKSLPHQIDKAGSPLTPQASVVSSPSELHEENQKASHDSSAPSASPIQHAGSLEAFVARLHPSHAQESQSSTTTAHPEPAVPVVSEIPGHLAQALLQQFGASHDAATKNLSIFRTDHPKMFPSSLYLSFLLKNTDGMICLLPMQESPLPASFPNISVGTLVSVQQILAASNSSLVDLANLQNGSPSSLILVKPVFILFPTDRADLQMVPSPQGEDDHRSALLFTNKQGLTMVTNGHSRDIPEKTSSSYPTSESLRPQTTLSTASDQRAEKAKVTSQPVLTTASYVATPSSFQATAPAADHFLDLQLRTSTAAQAAHPQELPEGLQAAPAPSPGAEVPSPGGTATKPPASPGPPVPVPAQHSPTAPTGFLKAEKSLSSSVTPLLSAVGLTGLPRPAQPPFTVAGAGDQGQRGTGLALQTTTRGQGSVSPSSSAQAQCTECLSSAGTVKYPLKMSPSIVPLPSTSQSQPSTESLRRLPSQVPFVPSTVLAFSGFPAGNDGRSSAADSTASSGVTLHAKAASVPPTSIKPDLTTHLEFITIVPKPIVRMETPTPVPARTLLAAKVKTAASGKLLVTSTPPRMYSTSPMSLPSQTPAPVSVRVPLPSAVKQDQSSQAPSALSSPANVGENGKPTEGSTSPRKQGFLGTSTSLPAVFSTKAEQPPAAALGSQAGVAPAQPSAAAEPVIALESEPKLTQTTSPSPLAVTSLSAAKNDYITTSVTQKIVFFLPTSALQSDPNVVFTTMAVMNSSAKVPASGAKSEDVLLEGDTATASQELSQAATSSAPQAREEKVPREASMEQDALHSSQHAAGQPTGPSTAKSLSVPASKVTSEPAASNKAADDDAETLLTRDLSPLPPTTESPSRPAGAMAARTVVSDPQLGATGTEAEEDAEEEAGPHWVTHRAPTGSEPAPSPLGSEPRVLLSDSRQRRVLQQDGAVLSGIAVVSDDACGSGNYTVQMSLRPVAEASPELQGSALPQDTFLASLAMRSSSSQPVLRVRSCCVTPSSSPGGPGAVCCLLPRLLPECRHIQLLQSSEPRAASFTIQLFQMLNHSVAYLHCELSVCLHGKPGCEQGCFDSVEPLPQPGDRNSPGQLRNLVSFGPVLRLKDRFLYKPVQGPDSAVLVPILLGSLTGFAVLGSAFISLWLHHRQKTKSPGCPRFGEIRGL